MTEFIFTLSYINCSTVLALKFSTTRIFAYCGCPALLSDTATITLVLLVPRPRLGTVPFSSRPVKNASSTVTTPSSLYSVSYTHLRAHETRHDLVCRLLLEKKKKN